MSAALQVAVVQVGFLNDAFATTPLDAAGWLTCAALASAVLWAAEAKKLAHRTLDERGRRPDADRPAPAGAGR